MLKPVLGPSLAVFICSPFSLLAEEPETNSQIILPFLSEGDDQKAQSRSDKPEVRSDEPGDYCDFNPLTG